MADTIILRRAVLSDKDQLAQLYETAIRSIGPKFYSPEQINAWAGRHAIFPHAFETHFATRRHWVAEDSTSHTLMAYIDIVIDPNDDGHIDFFYARPEVTRSDVTQNLYALLEADSRNRNIPRLYTEASEAARRFFKKRGFIETSRNDLYIEGVAIQNYTMEKLI